MAVSQRPSGVDPHYIAGYDAIQHKQWEHAVKELEESYRKAPQPITAYLTMYAYSRIGDVVGTRAWGVAALRGKPPLERRYRIAAARLLGWADATERRVTIRMVCAMEPMACEHLTTHPLDHSLPDHVNVGGDSDVNATYGTSIDATDARLNERYSSELGRLEGEKEELAFRKTHEIWLSHLPAPDAPLPEQ
jgi:hypothetical protein